MFHIGRKNISDEIDSGLKQTRGHFYLKILQTILKGVQYLDSEIGIAEDLLQHSLDGSKKGNVNYPLTGIWDLLQRPINTYMELDPTTLEQIVNTARDIVESAPPECRNKISDLTEDNEELKFRIASR